MVGSKVMFCQPSGAVRSAVSWVMMSHPSPASLYSASLVGMPPLLSSSSSSLQAMNPKLRPIVSRAVSIQFVVFVILIF